MAMITRSKHWSTNNLTADVSLLPTEYVKLMLLAVKNPSQL